MSNFWESDPVAAPANGGGNFWDNDPVASAPAAAPTAQGSSLSGVAKSLATGLAQGVIGLAGIPGDIDNLLAKGNHYRIDGSGFHYGPAPTGETSIPTSDSLQKNVEGVTGEFYKPQGTAEEYARTLGQFAPAVIGGPETMAAKIATRVALPALASETAGQLTKGTDAEPYARVVGALASPALLAAGRRAITPLPASPERQALAATMQNEGVGLTAGQRTGSKPLQWMESALGDTPGSGGPAARIMENQGEQFTGAALRRAGIDANRAMPEVMDNAFQRIGNDFEGVAQRNNVHFDPQLGNDLTHVAHEYNNVVSPSNRAPVIENTIDDLGNMATQNGGHLTGEQYNAITSRLARQARGAVNDPQLQEGLQGLRTSLDDAMARTLFRTGNIADLQVLRTARNQYRNLMVLERAATGSGPNTAEGLISPSHLRNAVVQQSRRAYGRGQGDFADLARSGEALLKPLPQSGTSPRHNVTHLLQTVGAVVGGGAGSAGGPAGTALGAAAGLAAPAIAGRALLSRPVQAYLGNQVLSGNAVPDRIQAFRNLMLAAAARKQQTLPPPNDQ